MDRVVGKHQGRSISISGWRRSRGRDTNEIKFRQNSWWRDILNPLATGVPYLRHPIKISIAGHPASVKLYQSYALTQQRATAGGRIDSGEAPPADFWAAWIFLFWLRNVPGVSGLSRCGNLKIFILIFFFLGGGELLNLMKFEDERQVTYLLISILFARSLSVMVYIYMFRQNT